MLVVGAYFRLGFVVGLMDGTSSYSRYMGATQYIVPVKCVINEGVGQGLFYRFVVNFDFQPSAMYEMDFCQRED